MTLAKQSSPWAKSLILTITLLFAVSGTIVIVASQTASAHHTSVRTPRTPRTPRQPRQPRSEVNGVRTPRAPRAPRASISPL